MEPWGFAALVAVGAAAGFVNVMAGGGSLLTLPTMIFLGLPPATANGTNRIAILAQSAVSVAEFRRRGHADPRLSLRLSLATIPGAVLGAVAAVRIDPVLFQRVLGVVMLVVLVAVLTRRARPERVAARGRPVATFVAMLAVGFYGGFIQAGVGFLIMAALQHLLALDLVRVNMHKVFIAGLYTVPALAVFVWNGDVDWWAGAALAVGNMAGGWWATAVAVERGEGVVKVVFAAAVLAMAVKLLVG